MNFEICKKCLEKKQNVFLYITIQKIDVHKGVLKIQGILHSQAPMDQRTFTCGHEINIKNIDNKFLNAYYMSEQKFKEILLQISEPNKTCPYYCEHLIEEINNK